MCTDGHLAILNFYNLLSLQTTEHTFTVIALSASTLPFTLEGSVSEAEDLLVALLHGKDPLRAAPFSRQRELCFLVHVAKIQEDKGLADSLHFSNYIFFFPLPSGHF